MKKSTSVFWGVTLVALGVLLILAQQNVIRLSWDIIWPGIIILLGILFHFQAFMDRLRNPGLLVPGGILLVYGGLFMYCALCGWNAMSRLWPLFILGPALGLAELKALSGGREGSWIPVVILTIVGGFFLLRGTANIPAAVILASVLILIGVLMIVGQLQKSAKTGVKPDKGDKPE